MNQSFSYQIQRVALRCVLFLALLLLLASTSGDSSHCSVEDLPGELLYPRSMARPDDESASSLRLKSGFLKKKDVRLKGIAVSVCVLKCWCHTNSARF